MSEYYLPEEILIQILARLPVKSLLKFRCVAKSWNSLISSPDFINTHLNLNKKNNFLLFKHTSPKSRFCYSLNHEDTLDEYACFEYQFTNNFTTFEIKGCCNGLLCVSDYTNTTIILWNPTIKKYVNLPTPNITSSHWICGPKISMVGFGFDNRANDYKVVRIVHLSTLSPPEVELCELRKGYWRSISCNAIAPYLSVNFLSQTNTNGVVHWIALDMSNGHRYLIVAFDMVDEVFREMALPDSIVDSRMYIPKMSIHTFEDSLVVSHIDKNPSNNHCSCSVWVMKEYGVAKSWVKQFNIVLEGGLNNVQSLTKNGELLLGTTSGQLVLCNPKDQQMEDVEFCDPDTRSWYVDTCMESLVLLDRMQTDSCDSVTSKRRQDEENKAQQCPTILEEAKTTKKTGVEIGVGSSKS